MYNNGKALSSSSASVSASDQQQRRHRDDEDDGTAAAAALIDSYFLPGGILDPEESGQGQGQGQPQSKVIKSQPQSHPPNQNRNATTDAMRSRLDRAIGGSSLEYQMMGNEGTMATGDTFDGGVNTTSGSGNDYSSRVGVGVGALDPSSDDVVGGMPIFGMASRNSHQVHQQRGGSAALHTTNMGGGGLSMINPQDANGMNNHMNMNNMNVGMGGVNTSRMNVDMSVGGYPQTSGGLGGISQHNAQHHNQHHPRNNSVHSQMGSYGFNTNSVQNQQQSVQSTSRNLTPTSNWFVESPVAHMSMNGYSQQQGEISDLLGALQQQAQQQPNAHAHVSRDVQTAPIGSGKGSAMQMSMGREGHLSTYSSSNESQSRATSVAATHLHHNVNPWGNTNSNSNSNESLSKKVESSNSLQFAAANVGGGNVTLNTTGSALPNSTAQVINHHIVHNNSSSLSPNNTFPHEPSQSSGAAGSNLSSAAAVTTTTGILGKSSAKSLAIGSALHPHQVTITTKPQSTVLPQSVRPPPGFSSSSSHVNAPASDPSSRSVGKAQQVPLVTHANANATSPSLMDQHNQDRMMPSIHNSTRYTPGLMNHGNDASAVAEEQERQHHHHNLSAHAHTPYRHKKYAQHLHNDGDFDLMSLNSKSSRDVPSTIYVRSGNNTDEEDLTACADSITVTSLPVSKVENEPMDVVVETIAPIPSEEKKPKTKRQKKKRNKKKQQQQAQESAKSQDTTAPDIAEEPNNNNADSTNDGEGTYMDVKEPTPETNGRKSSRNQRKEKLQGQKRSKNTNTSGGKNNQKQSVNGKSMTVSKNMSSLKTQDNSRTSAATTAISSTATTVQRLGHKKSLHNKSAAVQSPVDHGEKEMVPDAHHVEERKIPDVVQNHKEVKRQVSMTELVSIVIQKIRPIALAIFSIVGASLQFIFRIVIAWVPRKERFWFLLPAFSVTIDLIFLITALICKVFGKIIYFFLLCHKLAFLELLESDSAALCYAVIFFYPTIVEGLRFAIPYQDYWPVFVRWLAIDRWFCRPITMKDTYLSRLRKLDRRQNAMRSISKSAQAGDSVGDSMKQAAEVVLKQAKEDELPVSERVTMANHILLILRKVTPLILMLEINIHRDGFLMLMTNTERTLFGYGLAVLRSGYLFSSMIWISWTIQLTLVMFAPSNTMWCHFIFVIGLVSIRVSHYTAAVEDYEGVDSLNSHSTSNRRKKASRLFV